MSVILVPVSTAVQIRTVESLAREIWTEHYIPIIGKEHVEYMLGKFQSKKAISEQIYNGVLYFLVEEDGRNAGYTSVEVKENELYLGKLYVESSRRGRGLARSVMGFLEDLARQKGLGKITLRVNKRNKDSIKAYLALGFRITGPDIKKIGAGFVMDDYLMEKNVVISCYYAAFFTKNPSAAMSRPRKIR